MRHPRSSPAEQDVATSVLFVVGSGRSGSTVLANLLGEADGHISVGVSMPWVHSALATADAIGRGYDIVHYHALGPGLVAPAARYLARSCVVQTIHGRDDQRAKWQGVARTALRVAGWMSARVPDATIVVSNDLARHYAERHDRAVTYIPNGATTAVRLPPTRSVAPGAWPAGPTCCTSAASCPRSAPTCCCGPFGWWRPTTASSWPAARASPTPTWRGCVR